MRALFVFAFAAVSCAGGPPNTELQETVAMVRGGEYRSWPSEPAPHASSGPHGGQVRTFANPLLFESLRDGGAIHPAGSVIVKELFTDGRLTGWAVDSKGADGGWRFFEGFEPTLDQYFFEGTDNGCAGCHRSGVDYVLTPAGALRDAGAP